MKKFIAKQSPQYAQYRTDNCQSACETCKVCQKETRDWDQCWSACDSCNRCHARWVRQQSYNEPYNYRFPFYNQTLKDTPLSGQFCDNVCGVNMCNTYRKRNRKK